MEEKIYTLQEVAELFKVTQKTIRNYLKEEKLQGFKMGNRWRFTQSQVDQLIKNLAK